VLTEGKKRKTFSDDAENNTAFASTGSKYYVALVNVGRLNGRKSTLLGVRRCCCCIRLPTK